MRKETPVGWEKGKMLNVWRDGKVLLVSQENIRSPIGGEQPLVDEVGLLVFHSLTEFNEWSNWWFGK